MICDPELVSETDLYLARSPFRNASKVFFSFDLITEKDAFTCSLTCFKKKMRVYWKR